MKILFATDGSSFSAAASEVLLRMPLPAESELTVLTVVDAMHSVLDPDDRLGAAEHAAYDDAQQALCDQAQQLLTETRERFRTTGWTCQTILRKGPAAREIIQTARQIDADVVVLGSRGLGSVKRFLLGSVSHKVMLYAPCSVLIARPRGSDDASASQGSPTDLRLLLAYDGSPCAQAVVETLQSLPFQAHIHLMITTVLMVMKYYGMDILQTMTAIWQAKKDAAQAALDDVAQQFRALTPHVTVQLLQGEDPSHEILHAASTFGADCIVMGHQGHSAYERFFVGSVANRVSHHAPCSVWVMRQKASAPDET